MHVASPHWANPAKNIVYRCTNHAKQAPTRGQNKFTRQHGSDEWTIDELQGALLIEITILEIGSHHPFKNQSIAQITASNSVRKTPHTANVPCT